MNVFATRLRQAMAAARVSQAALARALDVSRAAVARWASEDPATHNTPVRHHLERAAALLGVGPDWLLGETGDGGPPVIEPADDLRAYQHSRVRVAKRDVLELLRVTLVERGRSPGAVGRVIELPGGRPAAFDYVTRDAVAELVVVSRPDADRLRALLWRLALVRVTDQRHGYDRAVRLVLYAPGDGDGDLLTYLAAEAAVFDIDVHLVTTPAEAARALLD